MRLLKELYKRRIYRGPSPAFMKVDLARALWVVSQGEISRKNLSQKLGIGEGSTRSILSYFLKRKLIKITRQGCSIASGGEKMIREISKSVLKVSAIRGSIITFNQPAFGVHLGKLARKLNKGLEERDEAIKAGALGATVLIVKNGRLAFPGSETNDFVRGEIAKDLRKEFMLADEDVLILSYSQNGLSAERGAWNAALYLIRK